MHFCIFCILIRQVTNKPSVLPDLVSVINVVNINQRHFEVQLFYHSVLGRIVTEYFGCPNGGTVGIC